MYGKYHVYQYRIPGVDGVIAHYMSTSSINAEPRGPDAMWHELQTTDIGLRRLSMPGQILRGGMLTQHFAVNYGMPYKFIAAADSFSFEEACDTIKNARAVMAKTAGDLVKSENHQEFNEVLALGYFENQSISVSSNL